MTEEILRLDGVTQEYGDGDLRVRVLQDVSLSVRRRELVAIMGPSGSGKSTLLSIAGGLQAPAAGGHLGVPFVIAATNWLLPAGRPDLTRRTAIV